MGRLYLARNVVLVAQDNLRKANSATARMLPMY